MKRRLAAYALLAAGCDSTGVVEGTVQVVGMSPRAGITVRAESHVCTTVTTDTGTFALSCPTGLRTVVVEDTSRPHFPASTTVDVRLNETVSTGTLAVVPRPPADGLWEISDQGVAPLASAHLVRIGDQGEKAYCLPSESASAPATASPQVVVLIDQQSPAWRLFPLDDQGCAQHWEWHAGDWRATSQPTVQSTSVQLLPGAAVHNFALEPGSYFVADWSSQRWTPDRAHSAATGEKRYMGALIVVAE